MDSIMMSPYKGASTAVKRVCIQKRIHVHSSIITYMQMNKTLMRKPCVSTGKRILNLQENCSTYADSKYATLSWSSFARVNRCLVHRVRVCDKRQQKAATLCFPSST